MTKQPPSFTNRQLNTIDILQRNKMAWIMFWFLIVVVTIVFGLLVYSVFFGKGTQWLSVALALLEGVFGWGLKSVISFLFPPISREKEKQY